MRKCHVALVRCQQALVRCGTRRSLLLQFSAAKSTDSCFCFGRHSAVGTLLHTRIRILASSGEKQNQRNYSSHRNRHNEQYDNQYKNHFLHAEATHRHFFLILSSGFGEIVKSVAATKAKTSSRDFCLTLKNVATVPVRQLLTKGAYTPGNFLTQTIPRYAKLLMSAKNLAWGRRDRRPALQKKSRLSLREEFQRSRQSPSPR